jgi:hypothetical protein
LDGVVPRAWRAAVADERGRVEPIPYELCELVALRDALRRREIYVDGANRWRNPDDDLPGDFETTREVHYAAIRQPLDPTEFIAGLRERLAAALDRFDSALEGCSQGKPRTAMGLGWGRIPVGQVGQPETGVRLQTVTNRRSRRVRYPPNGAVSGVSYQRPWRRIAGCSVPTNAVSGTPRGLLRRRAPALPRRRSGRPCRPRGSR